MRTFGTVEYAIIKTQKGILTYYTGSGWTSDWRDAKLFPNEKAARNSVISRLKDFNTKRFIDGSPAT